MCYEHYFFNVRLSELDANILFPRAFVNLFNRIETRYFRGLLIASHCQI